MDHYSTYSSGFSKGHILRHRQQDKPKKQSMATIVRVVLCAWVPSQLPRDPRASKDWGQSLASEN